VLGWVGEAGFAQILFLTGSDAAHRIDAQLQGYAFLLNGALS
jgi:hypothetical protein